MSAPHLLRPASARRHVAHCLSAIERLDGRLHAMIATSAESAVRRADMLDMGAASGVSFGLLHGVAVTLKDVIAVAGMPTTNGAQFEEPVPTQDAPVVTRLLQAGAILIGKANLHELAYGGTSQNPFWGSCRNPWDTERIPGGSSGGSAVAVAAGMCLVSLGTDSAGSVRLPAALTGVAGLRPTAGRISLRGVTPLSPPFDTIGPLARRVSDIARVFTVLTGYDLLDPQSAEMPVPVLLPGAVNGIDGLRIGIPQASFFFDTLDPGVAAATQDAMRAIERLGATLVDLPIPEVEEATAHFEALFHSDAAATHAERLAQAPERFGADTRERLEKLGGAVSGIAYARAAVWGRAWRRRLQSVLADVDAVVHATTPAVAPLVAECAGTTQTTRRLAAFCYPWTLARVPVLSVPSGFGEHGMPCGLSIVAPWWREDVALRIGEAFQRATDWHLQEPAMIRDLTKGAPHDA